MRIRIKYSLSFLTQLEADHFLKKMKKLMILVMNGGVPVVTPKPLSAQMKPSLYTWNMTLHITGYKQKLIKKYFFFAEKNDHKR